MNKNVLKKTISCLLAVTILSGLSGCQSSLSEPQTEMSAAQNTVSEEVTTPPVEETERNKNTNDNSTIIVYYSATGNTERVAEVIAAKTGGSLFKLEPIEPYSNEDLDWTDENSRVSMEYENPDDRGIELNTVTVDNWDSYDTIYIGYPIWWGIAAWPVETFVKANDFTNKTIIPFCTSASSELGESGELLGTMAGTGNWVQGHRFKSNATESEIADWINVF